MMFHRALGAIAALCLAGCVTAGPSDPTKVATWDGINVSGTIPPVELVAAANRVQDQGRMLDPQGHAGGTYVVVPDDQLAFACARSIETDEGILQGCTVRSGVPSIWTYTVYVSARYPRWYRELIATHEYGHVGQFELGRSLDHAGFGNPSVGLIQSLGG